MFNQQNYINKYVKDNYKSIKIRIRKDNKRIVNKLENVENINRYILGLIDRDISRNQKYNFINKNVEINFEVGKSLRDMMIKAEEADLANDYGLYMNLAYGIDTKAKYEVGHHRLNESQWTKLTNRYCL